MYNCGCSSLFAENNLDLVFVVITMYKVSQGVSLPHAATGRPGALGVHACVCQACALTITNFYC